jgi:hypothetical protein
VRAPPLDKLVARVGSEICMDDNRALVTVHHSLIWGHAVVQLVEALSNKPEGRGFDSR